MPSRISDISNLSVFFSLANKYFEFHHFQSGFIGFDVFLSENFLKSCHFELKTSQPPQKLTKLESFEVFQKKSYTNCLVTRSVFNVLI